MKGILKGVLRWLGAFILIVLCAVIAILLLFIILPDNAIKAIEILKGLWCWIIQIDFKKLKTTLKLLNIKLLTRVNSKRKDRTSLKNGKT